MPFLKENSSLDRLHKKSAGIVSLATLPTTQISNFPSKQRAIHQQQANTLLSNQKFAMSKFSTHVGHMIPQLAANRDVYQGTDLNLSVAILMSTDSPWASAVPGKKVGYNWV